jgi:hypothetical protein
MPFDFHLAVYLLFEPWNHGPDLCAPPPPGTPTGSRRALQGPPKETPGDHPRGPPGRHPGEPPEDTPGYTPERSIGACLVVCSGDNSGGSYRHDWEPRNHLWAAPPKSYLYDPQNYPKTRRPPKGTTWGSPLGTPMGHPRVHSRERYRGLFGGLFGGQLWGSYRHDWEPRNNLWAALPKSFLYDPQNCPQPQKTFDAHSLAFF